jgi:Type IV secretion system pilin
MMNVLYFALTGIKAYSLPQPSPDQGTITIILSIVFGIIGALALLIITIAGFRYIISAGDPKKTADAKSTIIYALIGLVVAISAEAIVAFVVNKL